MEQRVLTLEVNGETVISKSFNYEAMCIIDDVRDAGTMRKGWDAVVYLFEGTKVTDDVLKGLSTAESTQLSMRVMKWFNEDMNEAIKNVYSPL